MLEDTAVPPVGFLRPQMLPELLKLALVLSGYQVVFVFLFFFEKKLNISIQHTCIMGHRA